MAKKDKKELSLDEIEKIVEKYIGVHPKYFWYKGNSIDVDVYKMSADGLSFSGFNPRLNDGK